MHLSCHGTTLYFCRISLCNFTSSVVAASVVSATVLVAAAECCACSSLSGGFWASSSSFFVVHRRCRRFCLVAFETHRWLSGSAFEVPQSYFILLEDQLM